MNLFQELFREYFIFIILFPPFAWLALTSKVLSKRALKTFLFALACILLLVFSEWLELYYASLTEPTFWRSFYSAIGYASRTAIFFIILRLTTYSWARKYRILNALPVILNTFVCLISIFWPVMFYFDQNNHFGRGPLNFLPFAVNGFYALEFLAFGFLQGKRKKTGVALLYLWIFASAMISIYLQTAMDYQGVIASFATASLILYYVYFLVNSLSRDTLTDAFIRVRFFNDIRKVNRRTFLLSLDVNDLKLTNDTYGHAMGDEVLKTFSAAVLACIPSKVSFYRIGGDEFAILYPTEKLSDVEDLIANVEKRLSGTSITFSWGWSAFSAPAEYRYYFQMADEMMYENKKKFHMRNKDTNLL